MAPVIVWVVDTGTPSGPAHAPLCRSVAIVQGVVLRVDRARWWGLAGTLTVGLAAGCSAAPRSGPAASTAADYLPLRVGAIWRYAITVKDGHQGRGEVTVDGVDYDAGDGAAPAYRVREDLLGGTIWTWDDEEDGRVACLQEELDDQSGAILEEQTYDPPITVLDERPARLVDGAAWPEVFLDTTPNSKGRPKSKRAEVKWEVESLDDTVIVPAGTFRCLRVRRTRKHYPAVVFWYAKGVGLVKQEGAGPLGDQSLALVEAHTP